jgi:hypothetical protein
MEKAANVEQAARVLDWTELKLSLHKYGTYGTHSKEYDPSQSV